MNRIVLNMVMAGALALGGIFAGTASAHGPHGHHGHYHSHYRPAYPIYGGYCAPYTSGYYAPYPSYYYPRPQPRVSLYFGF
jgi:hypothetical protein